MRDNPNHQKWKDKVAYEEAAKRIEVTHPTLEEIADALIKTQPWVTRTSTSGEVV